MTAVIRSHLRGLRYALVKFARVSFLVLLYYLVQTCVIPHLRINGIAPNLFMICSAILTVCYGKKYAFASGAVFGILLESMLPSIRIFNLVIYPALTLLCAQIFADMSEIRRELLRIKIAQRQAESRIVAVDGVRPGKRFHLDFRRKSADDMEPHLRIFLNALMLTLLYDLIVLIYSALDGVPIGFDHFVRMAQSLAYTALWCLTMFPARWFLGFYSARFGRKRSEDGVGDEIATSEKLLRELALEPDMPSLSSAFGREPLIKTSKQAEQKDGGEQKADPDAESRPADGAVPEAQGGEKPHEEPLEPSQTEPQGEEEKHEV